MFSHFQSQIPVQKFTNINIEKTTRTEQESIYETRKGPSRPPTRRGIDYLVYAHVLEITTVKLFGQMWPISGGQIWPKLPKTHLKTKTFDLSLLSSPYRKAMTDRQTNGHPFSIGPELWGWGQITLGHIYRSITAK